MSRYPSQQHKNGFKLQLLRNKCEEYQRKKFHQKFSQDPKTLYAELKKYEKEFQKLLKKKILNAHQYNILFPASLETDSSKFDSTLLFLLLRTCCGYTAPTTGWNDEPDVNDTSEIADLIRLKIGRNGIQHNPLGTDTKTFKEWQKYLMGPLQRLGCPINILQDLMPSYQYGLFPADPLFTGREDELQKIHNNVTDNVVVLVGSSGVGKSETARKYCHDNKNHYDGNIIWINAQTKNSLEQSFLRVALSLALKVRDGSNQLSFAAIIKIIHDYFKDEKLLFVYDNCTEETQGNIFQFLSHQHSNIITSQIKNWGQCYLEVLIDVFTEDQSKNFLQKNLPTDSCKDITSQTELINS